MISLVNFVINLGLLFLGLECVKAAKVPVLSYYSIFSYWLGFFLSCKSRCFYEMPQNCNTVSVTFGASGKAFGSGAW